MSTSTGVWQVHADGPKRVHAAHLTLEQDLEGWIEKDPTLVQEGLTIVGRQVPTEAGPLDLLAVDPQGQWGVIEIKRDAVRREAVAQAIDYASCIATMDEEKLSKHVGDYLESRGSKNDDQSSIKLVMEASEADPMRPVSIFLVGTGQDPGLKRMVDFLSASGDIPIAVVSFEVFDVSGGQRLLVRQLTEGEPSGEIKRGDVDSVLAQADRNGVGEIFRTIFKTAQELGLYPRAHKRCIQYAPPANRTRTVIAAWTERTADGGVWVYVAADVFEQFYGVERERLASALGDKEWYNATPGNLPRFLQGLKQLLPASGEDGDAHSRGE